MSFLGRNLFLRPFYRAHFPIGLLPPAAAGKALGCFSQDFLWAEIVILGDTDVSKKEMRQGWIQCSPIWWWHLWSSVGLCAKKAEWFCVELTTKCIEHQRCRACAVRRPEGTTEGHHVPFCQVVLRDLRFLIIWETKAQRCSAPPAIFLNLSWKAPCPIKHFLATSSKRRALGEYTLRALFQRQREEAHGGMCCFMLPEHRMVILAE